MKKVLLATRPLTPPWDEASKNFAYFLGRCVTDHALTLLGSGQALAGLPSPAVTVPLFRGPHLNLWNKIRLLKYLRKHRRGFDIVHYLFTPTRANSALIKAFALPPAPVKTLQTVATVRDDLYAPEALKALFFADQLVTYTKEAQAKLARLGFTNVSAVYPGIDLERFSPGEKDGALLKAWGCTPADFVVVYPGEYTRLGVTDLLSDMWFEYLAAHPETNIRFVFACRIKNEADRKKRAALQKSFTEAGLARFVIFPDAAIADMSALYRTADLVIFPVTDLAGKFDVPLIIIEAYACARPVILSDLTAFKEFSNEAICATVEAGSQDELIRKILYLKDNSDIRNALGKEARQFTEAHFDLRETARLYSDIYNSL